MFGSGRRRRSRCARRCSVSTGERDPVHTRHAPGRSWFTPGPRWRVRRRPSPNSRPTAAAASPRRRRRRQPVARLVGHGVVLLPTPDVDALARGGCRAGRDRRVSRPRGVDPELGPPLRRPGLSPARRPATGFVAAHAELARLGSERRHTTAAGWSAAWDGMRAMLDGRLDDAEAHTVAIVELRRQPRELHQRVHRAAVLPAA